MIYVDLSCDRISGQQNMQKALKERVIQRDLWSNKEDAKCLVYVQIPMDFDVNEWKQAKQQNKKIIFIHHYFRDFERYSIFKNQEAFNLVDLHIIIDTEHDLYKYMRDKHANFLIYEQVCVPQARLTMNYYNVEKEDSICYVGRFSKGIDNFLKYLSTHNLENFNKRVFCAMTPDKYHLLEDPRLQNINVVLNKTGDDLYKEFSKCKFVYVNYDMFACPNHFETVMLEAMAMGVNVILGENQRKYIHIPDFVTGFISTDTDLNSLTCRELSLNRRKQLNFLRNNFLTQVDLQDKNIENILSTIYI